MALIIQNRKNIIWLQKEQISSMALWYGDRNAHIEIVTKGAKTVFEVFDVDKDYFSTKFKEWLTDTSSKDIIIDV